jgi:Flp pilus assembly pilin Flp
MNIIRYYSGHLVRYLRGTRGVAAMEYAIIVGVVVVGVGLAVGLFQDEIVGMIQDVTADLKVTRKAIDTDQKAP